MDRDVYTQEGEKCHQLTIYQDDKDIYSVSKANVTGLITMRDRYQ